VIGFRNRSATIALNLIGLYVASFLPKTPDAYYINALWSKPTLSLLSKARATRARARQTLAREASGPCGEAVNALIGGGA